MSHRLVRQAAIHAALGDPTRLAIVEALAVSDLSPREMCDRLGLESNLLAHHLDILEEAGLLTRTPSAGDGRRKYARLVRDALAGIPLHAPKPAGPMLFVCTRNSARSQLASVLWSARTGLPASSAGTQPAPRVHRGAIAAARRHGLSLDAATPRDFVRPKRSTQVVTVCDLVHEDLHPEAGWWHWSIPDPVESGGAAAFDAVVEELTARIDLVARVLRMNKGDGK